MTITDEHLYNLAKAMNSESYNTYNYLAIGTTEVTAISSTDTILEGEIGARIPFTGSRTDNVVSVTALRSAISVIDTTNGDPIKSSGCHNNSTAVSTDPLLTGVIHGGITQTTNFDLEFEYQFTYDRG